MPLPHKLVALMSLSPELRWEGKYDKAGKKVAPVRIALPFQTVETINESTTERQRMLDLFSSGRDSDWRNRLIWGDKKYVLPALLPEFQGKVDLIYIDPPFATGSDFSYTVHVGDEDFTKLPSVIEQKAYRDTWGRGLASYLQWFYECVVLLRELLAQTGTLYVHLDWHVAAYARAVLDEVFGADQFVNEVIWRRAFAHNDPARCGNIHDTLFVYSKSAQRTWNRLFQKPSPEYIAEFFDQYDEERQERYARLPLDAPRHGSGGNLIYDWKGAVPSRNRTWAVVREKMEELDRAGRIHYPKKGVPRLKRYESEYEGTVLQDIWLDVPKIHNQSSEQLHYPTQKPEALLNRIIEASSKPGDLVLDCFAGSGTTAAAAEKLKRRWIASDLGRFAIHTTRKRLLSTPGVKPFVIQNLGKYERQHWQAAEFQGDQEARQRHYREFILRMYGATPMQGYSWVHGTRAGRMVHVGAVDAPVSPGDVTQMVTELQRVSGVQGKTRAIDVLGWDFAFELNEVAKQQSSAASIALRFFKIPMDVMDSRAVEQGDVKFFELAALAASIKTKRLEATVTLTDFVIPVGDVPADIQTAITEWSHWIDYWAVDWDNRSDTFHNEWQTYRTKDNPKLERAASHTYETPGRYRVVVKVIDILGNDTTKILELEVK